MNWMGGARYRVQQQQRQNNGNRPIYRFYPNNRGGGGRGGGGGADRGWRGRGGGGGGGGNNPNYRRNADGQFVQRQEVPPLASAGDIRRNNNAASRNYVQRMENKRPCPLLAFAKECFPRFGEALALQLSHELEIDKAQHGGGDGAQRANSDESLSSDSLLGLLPENDLPDPPRQRRPVAPMARDQSVPSSSPNSTSSSAVFPLSRPESRQNIVNNTSTFSSSSQATHISNAPSSTPIRESRARMQYRGDSSFGVGVSTPSSVSSLRSCQMPAISTPPSRKNLPVFSQLQRQLASSPNTVLSLSPSSVYSAMSVEGQQIPNFPGTSADMRSQVSQAHSFRRSPLQLQRQQGQYDEVSNMVTSPARSNQGDFDSDDDLALSEIPAGFSPGRSVGGDVEVDSDNEVIELSLPLPGSPMQLEERVRNFDQCVSPSGTPASPSASTISSQAHSPPYTPTGSIAPASYFEQIHDTPRRDLSQFRQKKMVQRSLFSYFQACEDDSGSAPATDNDNFKEPEPVPIPGPAPKTPAARARQSTPRMREHPPIFSPCNSEASIASATSLSQILAEPPRPRGVNSNTRYAFSEEFVSAQTGLREIRIKTPAWLATPFAGSSTTDDVYSEISSVGDMGVESVDADGDGDDCVILDLMDNQSLLWSGRESEPPELPSSPAEEENALLDEHEVQLEEPEELEQLDVQQLSPAHEPEPPLIDISVDEDIQDNDINNDISADADPESRAGAAEEDEEVQIIGEVPANGICRLTPPAFSLPSPSKLPSPSTWQRSRVSQQAVAEDESMSEELPHFVVNPTSPVAAALVQGGSRSQDSQEQEEEVPQYRFGLSQDAFENDDPPSSPPPPDVSASALVDPENNLGFMNINQNLFGNGVCGVGEPDPMGIFNEGDGGVLNSFLDFRIDSMDRNYSRPTSLSQQMESYFPHSPDSVPASNGGERSWSLSQPQFPTHRIDHDPQHGLFDLFAPPTFVSKMSASPAPNPSDFSGCPPFVLPQRTEHERTCASADVNLDEGAGNDGRAYENMDFE